MGPNVNFICFLFCLIFYFGPPTPPPQMVQVQARLTLANQYSWLENLLFAIFFEGVGGQGWGWLSLGVGPRVGGELGGWGRGELKSAFLSSQTISAEESLVEIKNIWPLAMLMMRITSATIFNRAFTVQCTNICKRCTFCFLQ